LDEAMARATKVERVKRGMVLKSGVDGRWKESSEKKREERALGSEVASLLRFIYRRNIR
jgi:hypothetical protein